MGRSNWYPKLYEGETGFMVLIDNEKIYYDDEADWGQFIEDMENLSLKVSETFRTQYNSYRPRDRDTALIATSNTTDFLCYADENYVCVALVTTQELSNVQLMFARKHCRKFAEKMFKELQAMYGNLRVRCGPHTTGRYDGNIEDAKVEPVL